MRTTTVRVAQAGARPARDVETVGHPDAVAELVTRMRDAGVDVASVRAVEARERFERVIRAVRVSTWGEVLEPATLEQALTDAMAEAMPAVPKG